MSKIHPNAAFLFILTKTNENKESILFIYKKLLLDYYSSDDLYWYDGYGKNGDANYLWRQEKLKQWLVAGKEEDINNINNQIINNNSLIIENKEILFDVIDFELIKNVNNNDFPFLEKNACCNVLKTEDIIFLSNEIFKKEFLTEFSGETNFNNNIKKFYPFKLIDSNFIANAIANNTFGINEFRVPFLDLKLKNYSPKEGFKKILGCFRPEDINSNYYARLKSGSEILDPVLIDKETGIFEIEVEGNSNKVYLLIENNSNIINETEIFLKREIKVSTVNKTLTDLYQRKINFLEYSHPKFSEFFWPNKNIWQIENYPDKNLAFQNLSDLFRAIFNELGHKILIVDPYYMGDLSSDLRGCQEAFINALNIFIFNNNLNDIEVDIKFLGNLPKAKGLSNKSFPSSNEKLLILCNPLSYFKNLFSKNVNKTDFFKENYHKYFKNNLEQYVIFEKSNIKFLNTEEKFHNRFWCGLDENDNIQSCIEVTNSVGNIQEVSFYLLNKLQLKNIISKYNKLQKNSSKWLCIDHGVIKQN